MYRIVYIIILGFFISCNSTKSFIGDTYKISNDELLVSMHFINDSICEINQEFHCSKVPESFKKNKQSCYYKVYDTIIKWKDFNKKERRIKLKKIYLRNSDTSVVENYKMIPDYEKLCLPIVIVNSNEYKIRELTKPGLIYYFKSDTLTFINNKINFGYLKLDRE